MVFVVIITFALSWMPLYVIFCVVKFWEHLLDNQQVESVVLLILPVAQWLGASNSCINPIVYAYMNRRFRLSFLVSACKLLNVGGAILMYDSLFYLEFAEKAVLYATLLGSG